MMFWHCGFKAEELLEVLGRHPWRWEVNTCPSSDSKGTAMTGDDFFGYIEPVIWHKCTERLPDDGTVVLAKHNDGHVYAGFYDEGEFTFAEFYCAAEAIAYWAHMPKGPTE